MSHRRDTAPPGAIQSHGLPIGHLNPAGDGTSDDGQEEGGGNRPTGGSGQRPEADGDIGDVLAAGRSALEGGDEGGEGGQGPEVAATGEGDDEEEEVEDQGPPFEKGSFFFKVDDKDKGHYKVRDVSRFLLTSMYKRKDRVTRTAGVSLLVGKLEYPPHEEKVISALFDTDRFSERDASQWWEDNGHRFEDARSLAEKKVILLAHLPCTCHTHAHTLVVFITRLI